MYKDDDDVLNEIYGKAKTIKEKLLSLKSMPMYYLVFKTYSERCQQMNLSLNQVIDDVMLVYLTEMKCKIRKPTKV